MKDKLKELYKTVILKYNKAPYNYEKREGATHHLEAYNPICGDHFHLYFEMKDGLIEQIHFHGYGCAISKASTSVLAKHLEGKSIEEALVLCEEFEQVVVPTSESQPIKKEEFEAFEAARDFPGRLQCATLSWETMQTFLNQNKSAINDD